MKQILLRFMLTGLGLIPSMVRAQTVSTIAGNNWAQVAVNPATGKVYLLSRQNGIVTVLDGTTNKAIGSISVSPGFDQMAINPATNKLYVSGGSISNSVTVIDCDTNTAGTIAVGSDPSGIGVNPVTNNIYVRNANSNDITIINGDTNSTSTVQAGSGPALIGVNPVTNKIYIADSNDTSLTIVDGATNATTSVALPGYPDAMAINSVSNKIYLVDIVAHSVIVMDGATKAISTISIGTFPTAIDLNPTTNKIYVEELNGVTVIDGNTNAATALLGGGFPQGIAVNQAANKIYAAYDTGVTIIDGTTNSGVPVPLGAEPYSVAVNPAANKVYLTDANGNLVIISQPQFVSSYPTTSITPLAGNQTANPTPAFTFNTSTTAGPQATQVYFQVDTWQNAWTAAGAGTAGTYTGNTTSLQPGFHILYAYALAGQQAATAPVGTPATGNIQSYGFLVVPATQASAPPTATNTMPFVTAQTTGALRNNYSGFVGFDLTVGSKPIQVSSLGRYIAPGNSSSHLLKIVQSNGVDLPNGSVSLTVSGTAGQYQYAALANPVTLAANTSYYLVSQETAGGDQWYDIGAVSVTSDATVVAPVYSYGQSSYYAVPGYTGKSYVPVNFLYVPSAAGLAVNITSPQGGATISGSVLVTVATTGSVSNLQLQVDGVSQGAVNVLTLDTTVIGSGSHTLTVVASDGQGNSLTSSSVTIMVSNGSTAVTPTGAAFLTAQSPGALRNNYSGFVGFVFTIGSSPVTVSSLGRYVAPSNSGTHIVKLVDSSGMDVAGGSVSVSLTGTRVGQYAYAALASNVTLQANAIYYLLSQETAGGDQWYDIGSVTSGSAAAVTAPVYSYGQNSYYAVPGYPGKSYVPVNFLYVAGTTALTASITSPQNGATVSGTIQITTATSGTIANRQLQVDGVNQGAANVFSLNTATLTNGSHTFTVIASDAQGNSVTSAAVTIVVSNGSTTVQTTGMPFVTAQSPGVLRNDFDGYVGFAFTTGSSPVVVSSLGRYAIAGNYLRHVVKLVDGTGKDVPGGSVSILAGGGATGWAYVALGSSITLPPNTPYFLLSQETASGDYWYNIGSVTTTGDASVTAPTYGDTNGNYYPVAGLAGQSYGPVSFLYQTLAAPASVAITSPASGRTFAAGTAVSVAFSATGSATSFQLQVDGVNKGSAVSASPLTLDTTLLANGSHNITVTASNGQTTVVSASIGISITAASTSAPFITGETLGGLRSDYTGYVGMAFKVGAQPITVTGLGSLSVTASADTTPLVIKLVNADGGDVNGGSISMRPGLGTNGQFNYVLLTQSVTLAANTTYILVSQETAGGSNWYDFAPVTSTIAAQVVGAVYTDAHGNYTIVSGLPNYSYVPVNFLYH